MPAPFVAIIPEGKQWLSRSPLGVEKHNPKTSGPATYNDPIGSPSARLRTSF